MPVALVLNPAYDAYLDLPAVSYHPCIRLHTCGLHYKITAMLPPIRQPYNNRPFPSSILPDLIDLAFHLESDTSIALAHAAPFSDPPRVLIVSRGLHAGEPLIHEQ